MAELNGGQITARQLQAFGVDTVFGVVAGPMIELFAGAQEAGLRVVGCRHEESAAFMASAWGFAKRRPGVVIAGSGPGMTNTLTSMHVASASAMPLLVLGGSSAASQRGVGGFQEADQVAMAAPACKWASQVPSTERIAEMLYLALGRSVSGRPGAVYLDYPAEIVARRIEESAAGLRAAVPAPSRPHGDPREIDRLADLLQHAERPLIMVGKGAGWSDAGPALTRLVNRGIPYLTSPMARGVIPDDHPSFVNGARSAALRGADVILMVGGRFNWIFGFGRGPRYAESVRIAQIDLCAEEMFAAPEVEIALVADAAAAAAQLDAALPASLPDRSAWLSGLREDAVRNAGGLAAAAASDDVPINPYRLVEELRTVLPRDASLAEDGETIMGIGRIVLPSHVARSRFNAGTTGCMGTGVPYAIGAKLARPEAASVALVGDYAFGAAGLEVETAARIGANVVFVVSNNQGIAGHLLQDHMLPPDSPRIASLLPADYAKMVEMVDGHAERVVRPAEIRPALERALAADRVALVHVETDPKAHRLSGGNYLQ